MIQHLKKGDTARLRAIRLRALAEAPDAFSTTFSEAQGWGWQVWQSQVETLPTFVWREGDVDLGMVRATQHASDVETAYLISLWVAPEGRQRGIATALVYAVIDWAQQHGFRRLLLDVGAGNMPARALYERLGFVPTGVINTLPPPRDQIIEVEMALAIPDRTTFDGVTPVGST